LESKFDRILPKIAKKIREGKVAIWYGAGISYDSGLPTASRFQSLYLDRLKAKVGVVPALPRDLPMEVLIECLSSVTELSSIIGILRVGMPNPNHEFIASLVEKHFVKTVVTTNQDNMGERALTNKGMVRGKDFKVIFNDEEFRDPSHLGFGNKPIVFKPHGTIEDIDSVKITLQQVASKELSEGKRDLIRYVFKSGRHDTVLVLGYSCSDEFDINPEIRRIEGGGKEVVVVQHHDSSAHRIEDVKLRAAKNPFRSYSGIRVFIKTGEFVRRMCNVLNSFDCSFFDDEVGTFVRREHARIEIEDKVNAWGSTLKEGQREFIISKVFQRAGNYEAAKEFSQRALGSAIAANNDPLRTQCYTALANVSLGLGEDQAAREYFLEGVKMTGPNYYDEVTGRIPPREASQEALMSKRVEETSKTLEKADLARLEKDYVTARLLYLKVIRRLSSIEQAGHGRYDFTPMYLSLYLDLSNTQLKVNELSDAEVYAQRALRLAAQEGLVAMQIESHLNLSRVKLATGRLQGAMADGESALALAEAIGDRDLEERSLRQLIGIYRQMRDLIRVTRYRRILSTRRSKWKADLA